MKPALRRATVAAIAAIVALMLVSINAKPQHGDDDAERALEVFYARMRAYATLHREVASQLPPMVPSEDPRTFLATQSALATAIKAVRPMARQGDFFTPAIATLLRQVIGDTLCGQDTEAMFYDRDDEQSTIDRGAVHVYDPYPAWATHDVPMILLQRLPSLPDGIEYRFIAHDLLLWDVDANLVVDILPDAISANAVTWAGCARA